MLGEPRDGFASTFLDSARQYWDLLLAYSDRFEYARCTADAAWGDIIHPLHSDWVQRSLRSTVRTAVAHGLGL